MGWRGGSRGVHGGPGGVEARSRTIGGASFLELAEPDQHHVLSALEAEARTAPREPAPFFRRLKSLTLYGYYTSQAGVTEELQEVFMPGRFDGDAPLPARAERG